MDKCANVMYTLFSRRHTLPHLLHSPSIKFPSGSILIRTVLDYSHWASNLFYILQFTQSHMTSAIPIFTVSQINTRPIGPTIKNVYRVMKIVSCSLKTLSK